MFNFMNGGRGSLMDEAGDLGGGGGIAPVIEAPEEGAELDESQVADPDAEPDAEVDGEPEAGEKPAAVAPFALVVDSKSGRNLAPEVKATFDQIKTTNPALEKSLRAAVFQHDRLVAAAPGGVKEIEGLRQTIETLGGENGIEEITHEVEGWRQFDQQYMAGDPKALEFLMESPQTQDAFLKIAPMAFGKYAELHPDGYTYQVCSAVVMHMRDSEIPMHMTLLGRAIADNPQAMEAFNQIQGYMRWMQGVAGKSPEPPKRAAADTRGADLDTRERTLTQKEWLTETAAATDGAVKTEFDKLAQGRTVTAGNKSAIKVLYERRMERLVAPGTPHHTKLQAYLAANDREGFRRYAAGIDRTEMPKALRAAFDEIMPGKTGPKPAANGASGTNGTSAAPGLPGKPSTGFTWTGKSPATDEIDYRSSFNTPANYMKGQAVLKDGRRVQWKR
jgi:hypothetical protein